MPVHTNDVVISQCNGIANNKSPLPSFDETVRTRFVLLDSSAGPIPSSTKHKIP